ncbi:MAG: hypothetical protein PVI21_03955 [Candidatus Woesebacteria bacterium]
MSGLTQVLATLCGKKQNHPVFEVMPCDKCNGESKCPSCNGRGHDDKRGCAVCLGSGRGECCVTAYSDNKQRQQQQ